MIPSSLLPPPSSSQADSGRCWKPGFLKENDRFSFSAVGSVHRLSPSPWHCWLRSRCPRQAQSELTQLARSLLALLTTNVSLYLFTTAPFLLSNPRTYHLQPPPPKSLLSASAPLPHTHAEHGVSPHTLPGLRPPGDLSVVNYCTPVLTARSTQVESRAAVPRSPLRPSSPGARRLTCLSVCFTAAPTQLAGAANERRGPAALSPRDGPRPQVAASSPGASPALSGRVLSVATATMSPLLPFPQTPPF